MPTGKYNTINLNGSWLEKSSDLLFGLGHLVCHSSVVYNGHILTSNTQGLDPKIAKYLEIKEKFETVASGVFKGAVAAIPISIINRTCTFGPYIPPMLMQVICTATKIALSLFAFSFIVGGLAKTVTILLETRVNISNSETKEKDKEFIPDIPVTSSKSIDYEPKGTTESTTRESLTKWQEEWRKRKIWKKNFKYPSSYSVCISDKEFLTKKNSIIPSLWERRDEYLFTYPVVADAAKQIIRYADSKTLYHLECVSRSFFIICHEEWMVRAREKLTKRLPKEIQDFMCSTYQRKFHQFPLFRYCAKRIRSGGEDESIPHIEKLIQKTMDENVKLRIKNAHICLQVGNGGHFTSTSPDYELDKIPRSWPLLQVHEEIIQEQLPSCLVCFRPQDMGDESIVYGIDSFERPFVAMRLAVKHRRGGKEKIDQCIGVLQQAAQIHSREWILVIHDVLAFHGENLRYKYRETTNKYAYNWIFALKYNDMGELDASCKDYIAWFQRLFRGEECGMPDSSPGISEPNKFSESNYCQITLCKPDFEKKEIEL